MCVKLLESFDEGCYTDSIQTERLQLIKAQNPDFASVEYTIYLKDEGTEVGQLLLKCNGYIEYNIYENYMDNGYELEAIRKLVEVSYLLELYLSIKRENMTGRNIANELGFKQIDSNPSGFVFKLKKSSK